VAGFEDTAPGGQMLMHVAADALRSSPRWPDVGEALASLASRHGDLAAIIPDAAADPLLAGRRRPAGSFEPLAPCPPAKRRLLLAR